MISDEAWKTIGIIVTILGARIWSMFEHRRTGREVDSIKFYINGELEKKLEEAREQGRQEERNKKI